MSCEAHRLTAQEVVDVFVSRPTGLSYAEKCLGLSPPSMAEKASILASKYSISVQSILDIWDMKARLDVTKDLEIPAASPPTPGTSLHQVSFGRIHKVPGRPKGTKDSVPRKRRSASTTSKSTEASARPPTQDDYFSSRPMTTTPTVQYTGHGAFSSYVRSAWSGASRTSDDFSASSSAASNITRDGSSCTEGDAFTRSSSDDCQDSPVTLMRDMDPFHDDWPHW